jgi:hypothetical protein
MGRGAWRVNAAPIDAHHAGRRITTSHDAIPAILAPMPSSALHSTLQNLAHAFADEVFEAIRSASLDELTSTSSGARRRGPGRPRGTTKGVSRSARASAPTGPKIIDERLARRAADEIEAVLGRVVAALQVGPMRAEEIQKSLGLHRKELPRVLALGLKKKSLKKKGQRRGTVYSVG